jgi:hypothetical protein
MTFWMMYVANEPPARPATAVRTGNRTPRWILNRCASDVLADACIEIDLGTRAGPLVSRPCAEVKALAESPQVRADLPGRCLCLLLADLDDSPPSGTAVEIFVPTENSGMKKRDEEK